MMSKQYTFNAFYRLLLFFCILGGTIRLCSQLLFEHILKIALVIISGTYEVAP